MVANLESRLWFPRQTWPFERIKSPSSLGSSAPPYRRDGVKDKLLSCHNLKHDLLSF